jgi:hypothetical protein
MSTNINTIHHSPQRSRWRIFWRNPLLLKIVVWLSSLSFVTSTGVVWADVQPVATFQPAPQSIGQKVSPAVTAAAAALVPPRTIVRPHHADVLTADNYLVGVNGSAARSNMAQEAIEISVPPPRQNTIDRAKESVKSIESRIAPKFKPQAAPDPEIKSNIPTTIAKKVRSTAGLTSNIVKPMKPRLPRGKSQLNPPTKSIEKISFEPSKPIPQLPTQPRETLIPKVSKLQPRLAFSQPKPMIFDDAGTTDRTPENLVEPTIKWKIERLAKISDLQITDPSFKIDPLAPPELPKQKIDLAPETQLTVGVTALDVNDFTDTIDPLFDPNIKAPNANNDSMITRFGTRAGIYSLVAGSGIGIRHRFSPTLEGSVGVLVRSNNDSNNQPSKSGGLSNNKQNTKSDNSNNFNDNGLPSGGLSNSYGTIAQLTYTPSQDVKIGLTYVYGYSIYPEIGSDNANRTDGGNSAIGLQTFARLNQNLALGGRIGFNKNSNFEFDKNIFTWSLTAALPDLGGKGNLAGIIVGQEPRVISASDLNVIDSGSAIHVEGFYKIEISKDFSITPAIVYQTGPNIDNIAANAGSIVGAIGVTYRF